jgi:hypothetical protein
VCLTVFTTQSISGAQNFIDSTRLDSWPCTVFKKQNVVYGVNEQFHFEFVNGVIAFHEPMLCPETSCLVEIWLLGYGAV